jgi:EmrB/QacA subfamily drug resistance transporter
MSAVTGQVGVVEPPAGGAGETRSLVRHFGLATLCLVLFLTFLDNTIVSVTLANVQSSLHTGVVQLQWIVDGYALVFASFMLPAGALADRFGRKRVMLAGVGLFCAGSTLAALAPNASVLIAARAVMGLGAAASEPGTLSMIRHLYTDEGHRARALGIWAAVSGVALAAGPLIGGTLVGLWSWRAIFWFNLFFGLVALVAGAIVLPESSDRGVGRLDLGGFLLGATGIGAATFAVMTGESNGYATWWVDALFAVGLVGLGGFLLVERRVKYPMLDVRYFRRPAFAGANVIALTSYFGVFSIFFFVALYLQEVGTSTGYATAIDFVPMALAIIIASLAVGRWVAEVGPRLPMIVGCVLAGVGIIWTDLVLTPSSGVSTIGWPLALAGLGFGTVIVPVTSTALSSIPASRSGMAASMTNTSRELGAVAAVTILGSIVNGQLTVNLLRRLTQIGIPKAFQGLVVAAVTTGTTNAQVSKYGNLGAAIQKIINEVVAAAYGAFRNGLNLSLDLAGALMFASAVLAALTIHPRRTGELRAGAPAGEEEAGMRLAALFARRRRNHALEP